MYQVKSNIVAMVLFKTSGRLNSEQLQQDKVYNGPQDGWDCKNR